MNTCTPLNQTCILVSLCVYTCSHHLPVYLRHLLSLFITYHFPSCLRLEFLFVLFFLVSFSRFYFSLCVLRKNEKEEEEEEEEKQQQAECECDCLNAESAIKHKLHRNSRLSMTTTIFHIGAHRTTCIDSDTSDRHVLIIRRLIFSIFNTTTCDFSVRLPIK